MPDISRADLLRVLSSQSKTDWRSLSATLGYEYEETGEKQNLTLDKGETAGTKTGDQGREDKLPLQPLMPRARYWYVDSVTTETDQKERNETVENNFQSSHTIKEIRTSMAYQYTWSRGQWQNCWDKALPLEREGNVIDIPPAIRQISCGKPVRKLPRKKVKSFNNRIAVIVERGTDIQPAWEDFDRGWRSLVSLFGRSNLDTYWIDHGVGRQWYHLETSSRANHPDIDPGIPIIIMGAFSALDNGELESDWLELITKYQRMGHKILLISCSPINIQGSITQNITLFMLDNRFGKRTDLLITALSKVWAPNTEQLRMLRLAIPQCSLADELLVFQSPQLDNMGDNQRNLKPQFLLERLNQLSINPELEHQVQTVIQSWQEHLGEIQREKESFQGQLHQDPNPGDYPLLLGLVEKDANESAQNSIDKNRILQTLIPQLQILNGLSYQTEWQPLLDKARNIAKATGNSFETSDESQSYYLRQQGRGLILSKQKNGSTFSFKQRPVYADTWQSVSDQLEQQKSSLSVIDQKGTVSLKAITKPKWAERIWHNTNGLYAAHQDGTEFQLSPVTKNGESAKWKGIHNAWDWASNYGIDQYGLWATLTVKNTDFPLRWIPPGNFLMGSPEDEEGRLDNETQHQVTLSKGFWLAETSCTQQQWQAIMGKTPADPQATELPVNNISWDDCQLFIEKLSQLVPDFYAQLPSEAQWEYACRAGTNTAYWWGNSFDGNKASNESNLMIETKLPQNSFGLRSMSGNLFEWCHDLFGGYPEENVIDPKGPEEAGHRVLRGGSWFGTAHYLRSANRDAFSPDDRYRLIGLRLAGGFDPQASSSDCKPTADRRAFSKFK